MSSKDQPTQSDIQPEGAAKVRPFTEDTDAEGHVVKRGAATEPTPDEPTTTGQPGDPDSSRFSDRNLKVHVVPVTW